ncbi:putative M protein repeat protein [Xylona heveae TC161]|uniref:Spindle assembly checkpoint component MAD1 n=1 Tax=Xylona heveae (strain CBS 132557 / TC161) TaxID=1328760 RepID=A0A165IPP6_XYLHT|nr:putative M protein repeat protein [Xylona heveae TC161]KZF25202.1 putative M protein repeat protein [Xylona heveae TC161]
MNEDLRAQLKALQYELETIKQDKEFTELRHQKELRDAQKQAEADFKRANDIESTKNVTFARYEALEKEFKDTQDRFTNEKHDLEKQLRAMQEQNRILTEEVDESQTELASQDRQNQYKYNELETKYSALSRTLEGLRTDFGANALLLQNAQQKISEREIEIGEMESENIRLRAQGGDTETLAVIKRELSEQIAHIKKLESTNREHLSELKHFRKMHKSVEVVEEEKRVMESKLNMMEDLRRELSQTQLQKQILEDERRSWTTYLQDESNGDQEIAFDTPVELARCLVQLRLDNASLLDRIGAIKAEALEREEAAKRLEQELSKTKDELKEARENAPAGNSRMKSRLERQRVLAVKEVEYLRAQLKMFDTEETTMQPENFDEHKTARIQELEDLVDQYRNELQGMNDALAKREEDTVRSDSAGIKRTRQEEPDERIGELFRKNRKLQDQVSELSKSLALAQKDLEVSNSQLNVVHESSRTRILELRSNPTTEAQNIKLSTLKTLKDENRALLAQLESRQEPIQVVPFSTLESARMDIRDLQISIADKEKRMMRLKEIWTAKSLEFREAVASILGWKMDFMPNGRVRVTSMFYPSDDDEDENSIIFDGANGTMKISGGPNSDFALEIRNLIKFWVEGRKEIPCFLAAMTLEFYEKTTRAARM